MKKEFLFYLCFLALCLVLNGNQTITGGYIKFKNSKEATDEYIKYAQELMKFIKVGFSA